MTAEEKDKGAVAGDVTDNVIPSEDGEAADPTTSSRAERSEVEGSPEAEGVVSAENSSQEDPLSQASPDSSPCEGEHDDAADADLQDTPSELVAAAQAEAAELRDRYTRLQAEWDNFRKRTASERASEKARAAEKLVVDLLPVLDDIERAIKHAKDSGDGSSLVEGVEAIQGKFLQILGKHQVEQVEAEGVPFDANIHQAIGTVEDDSVPEETVVQVYQQGYRMGDRVIRPAMVVTSTS